MEPGPGTRLEVHIEKLVHGGLGLARHEGRVILVGYVLPEEIVRVRITGTRAGLLWAEPEEILAPGEGRMAPPCPYFGRCGGCRLQHAQYSLQLEIKRAILLETLRRIGRFTPPVEPAAVSGPAWEYRNRVQFHLAGGRIGFFEADSQRLCPIEQCMIASPRINEALAALRAMAAGAGWPRWVRNVEVFTDGEQIQVNVTAGEGRRGPVRELLQMLAEKLPGLAGGALNYTVGEHTYRVGSRSFFQVNRFLIRDLVSCALENAQGETAVDLYAGVGLFSLPLAQRFARVVAVESSASAAADLAHNAAQAGLPVEVQRMDALAYLAGLESSPDFVLADPPRSGLGPAVVRELVRLGPPRITLVSCDPATLARDLAQLLEAGYRLERLALVDLFPQSHHIEAVAALVREGP